VSLSKKNAWEAYLVPIRKQVEHSVGLIKTLAPEIPEQEEKIQQLIKEIISNREPNRKDVMHTLHQSMMLADNPAAAQPIKEYYNELIKENKSLFNSYLYNEGPKSHCCKGSKGLVCRQHNSCEWL